MDPLEQARLFLDRFQANVNLQDPLPIRVPIYHLKHDEIEPAIVEWTRTYLDQFECPQCLLTPITRIVVDAVLKRCEESPQSCGYDSDVADYKPLQFNQEVISRVNATCMELLDNVRLNNLLATMRPQQTMDEPDSVPNGVHDSGHSMRPFYVSKGFKNKRRTMEDRHVCLPDFNKLFQTRDTEPTAFYGVYDGHGGQDAASFATSHLHYYIAQSKHYPHDMAQAFQEGFVKTDRLFCGKGEDHFLNSGSTAVVCFHRIASRQVDVAWVGDSQAMIVKRTPGSNLYNQLVHPTHSPNNPDERERIQAIGGAVMFWYGNYRVNGQLAVSRAIGNRQAKPYVSADPGISLNKLTEDDLFLVMASDGLWDACNEYFISMFVLYALRMFPNEPQKINDYLITCAKQKSSDNITVIIVFLKDPQTIIKETPFVEELEVKAKHRAAQEKNMNNATSNGLLAENTSIPLEDHKAFDDIQNFMLESAMVEPKSAASSLCVGPVDDMGFLSDGGLGPETDVDGLHESKQSPSPMLLAEQDEEEDEEQSLHRAVQAVGNGDTEHETASVGSVDTATAADYNPFGTGVESSNVHVVESPNALEVDINDSHADIEEEDPTSPSSVSADPVDLSEDHGSDLNVPHVNGTGLGASEYDHHEGEDGAAYAGDAGNEQQDELEVNQKPALMSEEIVPLMKSIDEPIVNDLLGADAIVDNKLIDQLDSFGISEAIRRQLIEQQVTGAPMHHHEHDEDDDDGQLVLEEKHSELDGAEKEDLHHEKAFDSDYGNDLQSADVKQDDDAGCCEDSEEDEWDYVKVNKQQAQELETTTPSDHAEFGNTKSDDSAEQQQHRFDQQDPEEERQVERLLDQEVAQAEQQKPKEEEQEEETEVEEYKQNNIDDEQQLPQEPQQQQQQLEENSEPEFNQQPKDEEAVLFDQQELEQQQQQQQQQEEEEETTVVPSIAETEQQATDILGDSSAAYSTEPVGVNETDDVISGGGVATEVVNLLNDSKEEIPQPTTAETTPSPLPGDTYEEQQPEEVAEERFESQQAEILSSANTMETSMFGGSLSGQSPMSPESPLTPVQDSNLVAQEKDLFGANAQDLVMDVHSASSPADEELNEKHMYETEEKAMHLAGAGAAGDMMGWQLNPEAKEFVPPCAAGTVLNAESTPFTPPRMLEHENFKLRDDAIVAQSPRKGAASSLEDMDLPQENDFQTEMGKRPHEFELEAENGVGEPISEQARVISPLTSPPMFEELREEVPATNGEHGGLYGQQVDADAVSGDIELLNKVQELPDGEEDVTQQEQQDTYAAEPIAPSPAFAEDVQVNLMETEPSSAKEEQYVEQKETVDESPIQTLGSDFVQDFSQLSFNNGYGTGDATTYGANPFLQQEIEAPVAPTVAEDVSPSYDAPSVVKEEVAVEALVAPVSESKPVEPVAVEAVSSPTPEPIPALAVTETTPEVVVEEQKPEDKPLIETTPSQDNASSVAPIAVAAAAATAAVTAVGVAAATAASNKTAKPKASAPTAKKPSGTASAPAKAAPAAASKVTASRVSASSTTTAAAARKPPTSAPLAVKKAPIAAKTTPTMNGGTKEARPASAASTKSTTLSAKTTKPAAAKPAASNNSTSSVAAARAKASSTTSSTTTKAASATGSSTTRTAPKLSAATAGAGGKTTTATTSSRLSTVGSAARPASATSRPSSAISEKSTTVPSKPATTVKRTVAAKSTVTNGTSVTDGTTKQTKTTTSSSSTTTSATSRASTVPKTSTLTAKKPAATSAGSTTAAKATATAKSTSLTATSKTTTATRTSLAPRPTAGAATSPTARKLQNGTAAVPKKMAASPTPIVIRKPGTVAKKDQQQQQQQKVKEEVASSETASATTVTTTTTTTTMAVESTIVSEGGGDVPNAAAAIDLLVAQNDQLVPHAM